VSRGSGAINGALYSHIAGRENVPAADGAGTGRDAAVASGRIAASGCAA